MAAALPLCVLVVWASVDLISAKSLEVQEAPPVHNMSCYMCTSYMSNGMCGDRVTNQTELIQASPCKSKCFIRIGEEKNKALYRGCFDPFRSVSALKNFANEGCFIIRWNGMDRRWCFCNTDRCNGRSMKELETNNPDKIPSFFPSQEAPGPPNSYDVSENEVANDVGDRGYQDVVQGKELPFAPSPPDPTEVERPPYEENRVYQGVDQPYVNEGASSPIYRDVEQVHYGDSNDLFVRPGVNSPEPPAYEFPPKEVITYEEHDFGGDFQPQPYYPYGQRENQVYPGENTVVEQVFSPPDRPQGFEEPYPPQRPVELEPVTKEEETVEVIDNDEHQRMLPVGKLFCSQQGVIPNPYHCGSFIACVMDPNEGKPILYPMKCPKGLFWDNDAHTCVTDERVCARRRLGGTLEHLPEEQYL